MPVLRETHDGRVPVKIYTDEIESAALDQLRNISRLPIVCGHVAAMPDVHLGKGATIGSVIPTREAIIPAAVGVDIGCGMNAVRLSLKASQLPDNTGILRGAIEGHVPVGFESHPGDGHHGPASKALAGGLQRILTRHPDIGRMMRNVNRTWISQMGTLGGGNHFIELCIDESDNIWVMLHSGSRGIGNRVGEYFIQLAKQDMGRHLGNLPDKDLAYFSEGSDYFDDYIDAVNWAQEYAMENRRTMMRIIIDVLGEHLPPFELTSEAINCHHNYVVREHHFGEYLYITRKGAIRAGEGDLGIIPGSMGTRSYIVRGKGDEMSLSSCAHGAGRRMSRRQAKKRYNCRDLERQTRGVECRKDQGVLDEIPRAYKDIDKVMENQADLVDILHRLKQIVCVKG